MSGNHAFCPRLSGSGTGTSREGYWSFEGSMIVGTNASALTPASNLGFQILYAIDFNFEI
jgi:hypothetical protein